MKKKGNPQLQVETKKMKFFRKKDVLSSNEIRGLFMSGVLKEEFDKLVKNTELNDCDIMLQCLFLNSICFPLML